MTVPAPIGGDAGLQPQRTALAWNRTALAVVVNALLVLRAGAHGGHTALLAAGCLLLAGAGVRVACGAWRRRVLLLQPPAAPSPAVVWTALAVAGLACGAGALSLCVGLAGRA